MKLEERVAAICFGAMAILTVADVISRETSQAGLVWAQKSAVFLMIWGGFLGASITSAKKAHLRPEIADKLWPVRWRPGVSAFSQVLTSLFCFWMSWLAGSYVLSTRELGDVNVVTGIPVWMIQLVIPYAFFSMGVRHLIHAKDEAKGSRP